MNLKEQFQIKTVPAFQAADGQKFHDLSEAQGYTRKQMLAAAHGAACKVDPKFARLDRDLFIDICLHSGKLIGSIMAEPLEPMVNEAIQAERMRNTHVATIRDEPEFAAILREGNTFQTDRGNTLRVEPASRRVAMPQAMAAPYAEAATGLKQAMSNVDKDLSREEAEGLDREIIAAMAQ